MEADIASATEVAGEQVRLAVIGAGAIGRLHLSVLAGGGCGRPVAVADPAEAAQAVAAAHGVPWFADHRAMLDAVRPEGAVVATPNATHVDVALDCLGRGVAALVEKPVADTVEGALRLARASQDSGVPVLVGHHRRHNPVIAAARRALAEGAIGRPVAVTVLSTVLKPDSYFEVAWRREPGGGPILINLIHEIDLIRHLFGEIAEVQALRSNAVRGLAVEDTAAVQLRLRCGVLASIALSDTAAAPWAWDLTSGELPSMARHAADSHYLVGTEGALSLPSLTLWSYGGGERGWHRPLKPQAIPVEPASPYRAQLRHFGRTIRSQEAPLIDAGDAARTLAATLAVHRAAAEGPVVLGEDGLAPAARP